jgi:hypothetical protein
MGFFVLFLNNHVVLVTELNVVIFRLVFIPWLLCTECKKMVVSLGSIFVCVMYEMEGMCRLWVVECNVMGVFFEYEL